jgi:predicted dehydrogenase
MKAAVIGYGSAGSRYAQLLLERSVDVFVSDPAGERREAAIRAGCKVGSFEAILDAADVAVVSSPNHLHRSHLEAALAANCDALVEKPLATESTGLQEVLADAHVSGRLVGVCCNLRFVEAIEHLRSLVHAKAFGRVMRVRADFGYDLREWRPERDFRTSYSAIPEQGGGILLDAIHEFDYLRWIFGDVARVVCLAGSRSSLDIEVEDVACALLDFESGVIAEVALDYASGVYRRGFEVVGEDACATWRWGNGLLLLEDRSSRHSVSVGGVEDMYARLIDDFLDAVAQRRDARTPGTDGLAAVRLVEAAREAAARGRAIDVAGG